MQTKTNITGIHHITAVASSAAVNLTFYEKILGLRLVNMLTQQLRGTLEVDRSEGTAFMLTFSGPALASSGEVE